MVSHNCYNVFRVTHQATLPLLDVHMPKLIYIELYHELQIWDQLVFQHRETVHSAKSMKVSRA